MGRSPCCSKEGLNRGAWTAAEDKILRDYIELHGEGRWRNLPKRADLKRCGKSCRLRWLNYLRPNIKRGNISHDEEDLIIRLHNLLGNRWSLIAGRLPGRTDNEIKNYWNTKLGKKVQNHDKKHFKTTTSSSSLISSSSADHCNNSNLKSDDHEKIMMKIKDQSNINMASSVISVAMSPELSSTTSQPNNNESTLTAENIIISEVLQPHKNVESIGNNNTVVLLEGGGHEIAAAAENNSMDLMLEYSNVNSSVEDVWSTSLSSDLLINYSDLEGLYCDFFSF